MMITMQRPAPDKRNRFEDRLRGASHRLGSAGDRVVRFVRDNREVVLASSAAELGARIGTSDATVVRTIQALGFAGLPELKGAILESLAAASTPAADMRTSLKNLSPKDRAPKDRALQDLERSTGEALDSILRTHAEALEVIGSKACRAQITAAVQVLDAARRIVVFGIGPSAALANYVSIMLRRAGRASLPLDATGAMLADQLLGLREGDALVILAYGRLYREVAAVFALARSLGLRSVLLTEATGTPLAKLADLVVAVPRGRPGGIALHGATLIALEAIIFSLAAAKPDAALASLDRLGELRRAIIGGRNPSKPDSR
jgi:DNA-binding MurR/RpiR family transcriptional regulator